MMFEANTNHQLGWEANIRNFSGKILNSSRRHSFTHFKGAHSRHRLALLQCVLRQPGGREVLGVGVEAEEERHTTAI